MRLIYNDAQWKDYNISIDKDRKVVVKCNDKEISKNKRKDILQIISKELDIPVATIYGVVTFYSFFSLKPKGRVVIGVCLGTACYVKGSQQVIDKFCEILKIKPGETTEDGEFTIDALRCIGACGVAPAVSINGTVYPKVSVSDVQKIINHYKGE